MKFSLFSVLNKLVLTAVITTTLVGCGDPDYATPEPATAPSTSQGRYLVVNAAPGSGTAQLRSIDNTALATLPATVSYLGTSAGYMNIPAGQRLLIFSTLANLNNNSISVRTAFNSNTNTTVFLTDSPTRAAAGADLGGVRTILLTDNLAAPAAGRAKIRFVNLAPAPGATAVSYGIFNLTTATPTALFSATPIRAYRAISTGSGATLVNFATFTEVNAGTYTLDVRSAATTPLAGTQQDIAFAAGKIYTLYVRGIAGTDTPLGISVVQHN